MSESARPSLKDLFPMAAAYGFFLLAFTVDILLLYDVGILAEGPPIFDTIYLLRTALIVLSSGLLVFGLATAGHKASDSEMVFEYENEAPGAAPADSSRVIILKKTEKYVLWGLIALSAGFLLLFLIDARAFYQLRIEDNILEITSAVAWFFSALVFFRAAVRLQMHARNKPDHASPLGEPFHAVAGNRCAQHFAEPFVRQRIGRCRKRSHVCSSPMVRLEATR